MMYLPKLANWSITNKCNLNCSFCFRHSEIPDPSKNVKEYILACIIQSGVKRITFTGGEPLLDLDLISLIHSCNKKGIFTSLHTNAILDKEFYDAAKLVDRVSFAIDGPDNSTNFRMRGINDYLDRVLKKVQYLKNTNVDYSIKTVVTRQNINRIHEMVTIIRNIKPAFWSIFQFRPVRNGYKNKSLFTVEDCEFNNLIMSIDNNDITLNIVSRKDAESYPIFLIVGNGNVYTNDNMKGDVLVGSLYENDINTLWLKITSLNKIQTNHLTKYDNISRRRG